MIHAQTARLAGELVLWGLVVGCGCLRVARGLGFTRRVADREMNGRLDVPALQGAPLVAASRQDEVRSGASGSSVFPLKRERVFEKKKKKKERRHRRDALAAAPAGVRGLLASHNGGSRGAAYLSAAGGLPGDKNTIHVYGNIPPLLPRPPHPTRDTCPCV